MGVSGTILSYLLIILLSNVLFNPNLLPSAMQPTYLPATEDKSTQYPITASNVLPLFLVKPPADGYFGGTISSPNLLLPIVEADSCLELRECTCARPWNVSPWGVFALKCVKALSEVACLFGVYCAALMTIILTLSQWQFHLQDLRKSLKKSRNRTTKTNILWILKFAPCLPLSLLVSICSVFNIDDLLNFASKLALKFTYKAWNFQLTFNVGKSVYHSPRAILYLLFFFFMQPASAMNTDTLNGIYYGACGYLPMALPVVGTFLHFLAHNANTNQYTFGHDNKYINIDSSDIVVNLIRESKLRVLRLVERKNGSRICESEITTGPSVIKCNIKLTVQQFVKLPNATELIDQFYLVRPQQEQLSQQLSNLNIVPPVHNINASEERRQFKIKDYFPENDTFSVIYCGDRVPTIVPSAIHTGPNWRNAIQNYKNTTRKPLPPPPTSQGLCGTQKVRSDGTFIRDRNFRIISYSAPDDTFSVCYHGDCGKATSVPAVTL